MVKKYNFKITVEPFLSSSDFERVRFKLLIGPVNLMAQKRDVIQCIFILKHLFRFENECVHSLLAKNRKRYSTPLRDILK